MELFFLPHAQSKRDQPHYHEEKKQELGNSSARDRDAPKSNRSN
jgi:hypothetical protein